MQEFHFPNWVNKFTFLAAATAVVVGGYLATCLFAAISPKIVNVGHQPKQPVPFSHKLHAGQLKMDCRYCHNTVERAGHAAIPPTATCGNCHGGSRTTKGERDLGIIRGESTLLKPIRVSLEDNDPVLWERVHDLPDFVYFNHSAHVNKGVSCVSCHGRIDKMEIVTQVEPLSMKWCLDCHRNPTPNIRDPQLVTQLDFVPENPEEYHKKWAEKLNVNPNVNCSTCHR
ncbi:MAG: cytochrome C [Planctomycetaceae bacterium]|jgi:menaquinone reductase, multiheme cytochrome c subunit|nr:cytochrome C [Planctomycetaceae bacterium]MCP4480560.1 cytochrome C [Planctomycetaceae bacterium]MCP4778529.1 cytochrome C [Planctomycetaceae bacterium]